MKKPVSFGIVGYGHIGKRHARHIEAHAGAVLRSVADISGPALSQVPDKVARYTSLEDLLRADILPDVLSVCTPNYLHADMTIAALQRGCHVLVEKPMALSVEDCDRMIAAAERHGKIIFPVKQNRYNPPVAAVKKLVDSGQLGKVFLIQVNCFWNRNDAYYQQSAWRGNKEMDGGVLFTQFSHFADILYYLNGPLTEARGLTENFTHTATTDFEDTGVLAMKAANGALISFCFTTGAFGKNMEGSITLFGEKGTVKIGGQYLNTIDYQSLAGQELVLPQQDRAANDYGTYQGSMSNHDEVIANVVATLSGDSTATTTAEDGRAVVRMIEQMYAGCGQLVS